jgi:hypothetical protein
VQHSKGARPVTAQRKIAGKPIVRAGSSAPQSSQRQSSARPSRPKTVSVTPLRRGVQHRPQSVENKSNRVWVATAIAVGAASALVGLLLILFR